MRARTFVSFILGFAFGMLCLGVFLWSDGGLHTKAVQAERQPQPATPSASAAPVQTPHRTLEAPAELPDTQNSPSLPRAAAPPQPVTVPPVDGNEADRLALPEPPHLTMPLTGVDPHALHSTFSEGRAGHTHEALDIMAPRGTPVTAVAEGNVVKLFDSKQGGLTVYQFDNSREWCFYYAHLDRYAPGLKEGMLLRRGDPIGFVGSTGNASPDAPHLHLALFRLGPEKHWWEGTAIDPLPLLQ